MRITFLTIGTRGDTQPYIALGVELRNMGYDVRIAAFENFESFVKKHGLEFARIKGDIIQAAASIGTKSSMKADNPLRFARSFSELKKHVYDLQKDYYEACLGSDIIVYHPGAAIGFFAARKLGIPSVLATPFPMAPTREFPSLIFYNAPRLGRGFNLLTHKILQNIMWMASGSPVKRFWKSEFGRFPEDFKSPYGRQVTQRMPTIISCSGYVFPRPADWPEHVRSDGYWFLNDDAGWEPPEGLAEFLGNGEPPVYVGFGSIGDIREAEKTTALVIDALNRAGRRGVLAAGWSGMTAIGRLPESVFMLESAPHSWLFPKMAAVVHHGGAGTTAAGMQAGVPGVIIPHGNDQFAWGQRLFELGAGARPVPRKKLTAANLAEAITCALQPGIAAAAAELGRKIRSENGAAAAAKVILKSVDSPGVQ